MKEAVMLRTFLLITIGLALLAPAARAKTVVVTEAQNGRAVTLVGGDSLVVRLTVKPGTGREWHVVYDPQAMLHLNGGINFVSLRNPHSIAAPLVVEEFRFTVPYSRSNFLDRAWLRFLYLSPREPRIESAKVWAIQYTIRPAK